MAYTQDDPRDVLAYLNSLGFVGVTAPQLKLFMKDLKLYRKIKKLEQQEWKERAKKKIKQKHKTLDEIMQKCKYDSQSTVLPSESTTSEESSIKIHFQYRSKDKENKCDEYQIHETQKKSRQNTNKQRNILEELSKLQITENSPKSNVDVKRKESYNEARKMKLGNTEEIPVMTQRNSRSQTRTNSARTQETQPSTTRSKSFIRPWKLQTNSQQNLTYKKSDPVALYHKYQQQWKQLSLPGENRHTKIRWEIREKMLGTDPNPRPTLQRSASSATLRKKNS